MAGGEPVARRPAADGTPAPRRLTARLLLVVLSVLAQVAPLDAQPRPAGPPPASADVLRAIRPAIDAMLADGVPSASVALVAGDRIVWAGGFGTANRWAGTAATAETVYIIGSTFKAMSAAALMRQWERGAFRLDDPVRDHVPELPIAGEDPANPVTFRHLLTHTSGLGEAHGGFPVYADAVPPPLEVFLPDALKLDAATGDTLLYSNLAFTLVGYLVQKLAGRPYRDVILEEVWQPLGMTSTRFAPTPAMEERLAVPYVRGADGALAPVARLKGVDYPAGIVYGTASDLGRWLLMNLNGGVLDGTRLLGDSTLAEMHRRQHDDPRFLGPRSGGWGDAATGYGLSWWVSRRNDARVIAHSGSMPGYTAFLAGDLDRRTGIAVLANGGRAHGHLARIAEAALDAFAAR